MYKPQSINHQKFKKTKNGQEHVKLSLSTFHILAVCCCHYFCLYLDLALEVPHADVVGLHGLDAEEELCQVVEHPPGEGVVVLTPRVLQVVVTLVVEHLV